NQTKVNYKLITAGTAGRACGLVEFAPGYEAGSRSVFSRAVVHKAFNNILVGFRGLALPPGFQTSNIND
ncbi:MAG: hypothetical protein PHV51_10690, partial [Methanosarcinaceae archaeon]|nr:hypothetical protein [Methanosarcinaceae archaeon]